jgi:hypothetical protein
MCHPTNFVTGEEMDAWVVDFGGMNTAGIVVEGQRETIGEISRGWGECLGCGCPGSLGTTEGDVDVNVDVYER